ncbi:hypothetical protein ACQBAR_08295 [Propionibacteriaceae bacterium Y1685]|uniref:hypothetical protein n=1 Tax=Microlunatus sp. Y1700 TaxID=3418487 RepID=UPI003B805BEB
MTGERVTQEQLLRVLTPSQRRQWADMMRQASAELHARGAAADPHVQSLAAGFAAGAATVEEWERTPTGPNDEEPAEDGRDTPEESETCATPPRHPTDSLDRPLMEGLPTESDDDPTGLGPLT